MVSFDNFEKECLVVGFGLMEDSHNAENIKLNIETLIKNKHLINQK